MYLLSLDLLSTIVYNINIKEIVFYQHTNNKVPVVDWLKGLDKPFRIKIQDRLNRIEQNDNFGDFKKIDNDICELRFNFGSGYKIYYAEVDNIVVLLLNAGDKKFQSNDISKAKEYLKIWRQNNEKL